MTIYAYKTARLLTLDSEQCNTLPENQVNDKKNALSVPAFRRKSQLLILAGLKRRQSRHNTKTFNQWWLYGCRCACGRYYILKHVTYIYNVFPDDLGVTIFLGWDFKHAMLRFRIKEISPCEILLNYRSNVGDYRWETTYDIAPELLDGMRLR